MADAAFEVVTAESAIVGLAQQAIAGKAPSSMQLRTLQKDLLNGSRWLLFEGGSCDLAENQPLLEHAGLLEQLRSECRQYFGT
jgi:hypothetical protein